MTPVEKQYLAAKVESATPAKLILLLYDSLLASLRRARAEIADRHVPEAHRLIVKAQDIVIALANALNMEAGEIAQNLLRLYEFITETLVKANLAKDPAALQQVEGLVQPLRDAWEEALVLPHPDNNPKTSS